MGGAMVEEGDDGGYGDAKVEAARGAPWGVVCVGEKGVDENLFADIRAVCGVSMENRGDGGILEENHVAGETPMEMDLYQNLKRLIL